MALIDFYVVDTHALIWSLIGDARLGVNAKAVFDNVNSRLILPTIALAEAIDIVQKKRTKIPDVKTLLKYVLNDKRTRLEPLTLEILQESLNAQAVPEMHDRLIAATVLHYEKHGWKTALLTKDAAIIAANLVAIVW